MEPLATLLSPEPGRSTKTAPEASTCNAGASGNMECDEWWVSDSTTRQAPMLRVLLAAKPGAWLLELCMLKL